MVRLAVIYALVFASGIISGGVVAFVILGADNADSDVELLFVQSSTSGTFDDGEKILTLTGVSPTTIYFSDRPNRITGSEDTKLFVAMWSEGADSFADDPPNAVLEIPDNNNESDVFIIELFNPIYDSKAETLQYTIKILAEASDGLSHYTNRNDIDIPATFESAVLFIDNYNVGNLVLVKEQTPSHHLSKYSFDYETMLNKIAERGEVLFIVGLDVNYSLEKADDEKQMENIQNAQDQLIAELSLNVTKVTKFKYIPYMAFSISDKESLDYLIDSPLVTNISEDKPFHLIW